MIEGDQAERPVFGVNRPGSRSARLVLPVPLREHPLVKQVDRRHAHAPETGLIQREAQVGLQAGNLAVAGLFRPEPAGKLTSPDVVRRPDRA